MSAFTSTKTLMANPTQIPYIAEMIENDFKQDGFSVTSQSDISGGYSLVMNKKGFFRTFFGLDQRLYVKIDASGDKILFDARSNILGKAILYQVLLTIAELVLPVLFLLYLAMEITYITGLVKQAKLDNKALAIAEKFESLPQAPTAPSESNAPQMAFCTSCGKSVPAGGAFCPECGAKL